MNHTCYADLIFTISEPSWILYRFPCLMFNLIFSLFLLVYPPKILSLLSLSICICYPGWYHDHPACVLISIPCPGDPCIVPHVTTSLCPQLQWPVTISLMRWGGEHHWPSRPHLCHPHMAGSDDGMLIYNAPDNCLIVSILSLNMTREELKNDPTECFIVHELF